MLKIRLQRTGKKNDPSYRVIVTESSRGTASGNFVERVGSHNPKLKDTKLDAERIKYWLSVGAQASGTVHNMLVTAGIITADKINVLPKKTPIVKPVEEKAEEEAAPADSEADTPESEDSTEDASAEKEEAPAEDEKKEEA